MYFYIPRDVIDAAKRMVARCGDPMVICRAYGNWSTTPSAGACGTLAARVSIAGEVRYEPGFAVAP